MSAGVQLDASGMNFVVANEIVGASTGIRLSGGAFQNLIRGNRVRDGGAGIRALDSELNLIALNAFLTAPVGAADEGVGNLWDDGAMGNFWADYPGPDTDGNGIGDVPYLVPPNGMDSRPLIAPP